MTSPAIQVDELVILLSAGALLLLVLLKAGWHWLMAKPDPVEPVPDNLAQFPPRWDESLSDAYDGPSDKGGWR